MSPLRRRLSVTAHACVGLLWGVVFVVAVVPAARVRRGRSRRESRPLRILWGPIPIVNIRYASLADRTQGFESTTLVYDVYSINSRDLFDHVIDIGRRPLPVRILLPYAVSIWAALRFDVFCFYFDGGLLYATPWWRTELALLRLAGRGIVVLPYGGDARLRSKTEQIRPWNIFSEVPPEVAGRPESEVRERLAAFGRYSNVM